jgi:hypothetical protein
VPVSGPAQNNGRTEPSGEDAGVLANLPRTRPQRATARRAAARSQDKREPASPNGGSSTGTAPRKARAAKPAPARRKAGAVAGQSKPRTGTATKRAARPSSQRPARSTVSKRPLKRAQEEVPRQGFESEEDRAIGAVPPPGGTEFVSTAAEIVGELAKAGISGGERLLRDVLSRLGR